MKKQLTSLEDFVEDHYGPLGTDRRDELESGYSTFRIGVQVRNARKKAGLTQDQLAERAQTKRSYISRLENDASDIRLSTLIRIIEKGLGGKVRIEIEV